MSHVTDLKFSAEIINLPSPPEAPGHSGTSPEVIDGPHPEDQTILVKPEVEDNEDSEYDNIEKVDDDGSSSEYEEIEVEIEVTDSEDEEDESSDNSSSGKFNHYQAIVCLIGHTSWV